MKSISRIARYLLGLFFTIFGLNGFLRFLPQPAPSSVLAAQFQAVLSDSHYMLFVVAFQLLSGLLLLAGRFVPLALTILAAILTNILVYHITIDPKGIGPAALAALLWLMVFFGYRVSFMPMLRSQPPTVEL